MKKLQLFTLFIALLLIVGCAPEQSQPYGVFLGLREEESERLDPYETVVIEPAEFSAAGVEKLRAAGQTVYGYLNIGAVEEYRPYYGRFQGLTLGVYENWPDERWVDVASPAWQSFIVDELGRQYADMGFDGLFLDNADVYDDRPTEEIFRGLCTILEGLRKYHLKFLINGGDGFVSRCIEEGTALSLFDGINQEMVFTRIDFEHHTYGVQPTEETDYFKQYLAQAKQCGLSVRLLEYRADPQLARQIEAYCTENGFLWFNAEGLELR
jgi:endo-alpha-1,4-polygalactosaminidase (GH114 family)